MTRSLHILAPAPAGGLESVVRTLGAGLVRAGAPVHAHLVVDPGERPLLADPLRAAGVDVHVTPVPRRRYAVERSATRDLCARLGIDVVHCHGYRPDVIDAAVARRAGVPVVSTVHGFTGGGWRNAVYEWLQLRSLRRMDRVIAVSSPLVDRLTRRGIDRPRVRLLPNAFDPEPEPLARAEARRILGLRTDGHLIGWIGRLSREKAPDIVVQAAAKATDRSARWIVVGDGPERAACEAAAAAFDAPVTFLGLVPDAGRLVRAFDVVVLSSRTEGTPIVALEAMAAGVPVVATEVGGLPDLLADGAGALVAPGRPEALAREVGRLLDEPGLSESRVDAARRRLESHYAVGPWVDAHLALYDEITSQTA